MLYDWRKRRGCVDQVANAPDASVDLTPASEAPAVAVRDGWGPLRPGQAIPLLWERVPPDNIEDC